ncbi:MAG: hypothetical protein IJE08_00480 [Clostridia bacterium]|nr:hypothetical protein [Clostridia bacterium]
MKKNAGVILLFIVLCAALIRFGGVGSKAASISAVYASTAALSLAAAAGYWFLIRKKNPWFVLLFSSVFVVNTGYLALSLSKTLDAALWANRLSYLGSVFLPLSMLMLILNTCRLKYGKYLPGALISVSTAVFLIAASPGILDIYYKEVSLSVINGSTVLEKVYGPLHCLYLFYLLSYLMATLAVIFHACANRNVDSAIHAVFMSAAVFVNIGVWLIEQLVRIDFELLSISYIISELFLLLLCLMIQRSEEAGNIQPPEQNLTEPAATAAAAPPDAAPDSPQEPDQPDARTPEEQLAYFAAQRASLTPTERIIYEFYLEGKSTKEIMAELNIKENTLKYHNKNIYSKLGVSSRKQLVMIASALKDAPNT